MDTLKEIIPNSEAKFNPESVKGFQHLPFAEKQFLRQTIPLYNLSFSHARLLAEAAIDLNQWSTLSAESLSEKIKAQADYSGKNFILKFLAEVEAERKSLPQYENGTMLPEKINPGKVVSHEKENTVFGLCPVASEKTVCCNLRTIDAVTDCALGCNYCAIQTMFSQDNVQVDSRLAQKLRAINPDPQKLYHFGTGQSSDSLLTGNRYGIFDALVEFCTKNKNVFLEFKSKSSNIAYFENIYRENKNALPGNMFFSWSVNPQIFIDAEEPHTAPLSRRLQAAQKMISMGYKVAFHFHPIAYFSQWEKHYQDLCNMITTQFHPKDIVYISMGSMTIPRSVQKKIRSVGIKTMVTKNLTAVNPENKLTYPPEIKQMLLKTVYEYLEPFREKVFFYLCMEEEKFWHAVFGHCYRSNDEFEKAMLASIQNKIFPLGQTLEST